MKLSWRYAAMLWFMCCGFLIIGYLSTWREMSALWFHSDSYAHGPLVPAISAWLVWRIRSPLQLILPEVWPAVTLVVLALAGIWAIGDVVQVPAVRHFAVLLMLIAAFAACFGRRITGALIFPLFFLLFAVPFGDFLTEPMMEQTADFTVWALRLTGVPVFREARYLQIPSGNWSVVEACSGTRYLIASVMLGTLYAYLFYRSTSRRLLFVAASILVPVVANWIRAYLIVMIGHLSNNKYGIGADHVAFGWVFFGIVIFAMFSIGARWREDHEAQLASTPPIAEEGKLQRPAYVIAPIIASLIAVSVPGLVAPSGVSQQLALAPLATPPGWQTTSATWKPAFSGERVASGDGFAEGNGRVVSVYRALYWGQRDLRRMIRWGNGFVPESDETAAVHSEMTERTIGQTHASAVELHFREGLGVRVIRGTYRIGSATTGSAYRAKLKLAINQLTGRGDVSEVIAWSTVGHDVNNARKRLDAFETAAGNQLLAPPK